MALATDFILVVPAHHDLTQPCSGRIPAPDGGICAISCSRTASTTAPMLWARSKASSVCTISGTPQREINCLVSPVCSLHARALPRRRHNAGGDRHLLFFEKRRAWAFPLLRLNSSALRKKPRTAGPDKFFQGASDKALRQTALNLIPGASDGQTDFTDKNLPCRIPSFCALPWKAPCRARAS